MISLIITIGTFAICLFACLWLLQVVLMILLLICKALGI